jgi:hypothetical protein
MNVFETRALEVAQQSNFLASVARQGQKIIKIDNFAYNTTIGSAASTIAAGAGGQAIINFQADSDFVIQYVSADALGTTQLLLQVTDTGSGRTFFNQPTLFSLVAGSNGFPYLLPTPKVVAPSTNLQVSISNIDAAVACTGFFISFGGGRIYYAG